MPMNTGAVYGQSEPVPLNGTLNIVIETPTTTINNLSGGARLSWNAVQYANNYKCMPAANPRNLPVCWKHHALYWDIATGAPKMFYKVVPSKPLPAKETNETIDHINPVDASGRRNRAKEWNQYYFKFELLIKKN
jgi:hypothetical protein